MIRVGRFLKVLVRHESVSFGGSGGRSSSSSPLEVRIIEDLILTARLAVPLREPLMTER